MMQSSLLVNAREVIERALGQPDLRQIEIALAKEGVTRRDAPALLGAITEQRSSLTRLIGLNAALGGSEQGAPPSSLARYLLVCTALNSLAAIPALRVGEDVKALFLHEFCFYAQDPGSAAARFDTAGAAFVAMCKTATLRRFPGGQFDWEISGIRRSDVLAASVRRPSTLAFVALRMRGLRPMFFSHLNWRRPNRSLSEQEANRSYYRMARALELQPDVKGFAACSWFRSPATHRVSPHLAWLSRVIVENGGFVVEAGTDDPAGGALHRSGTRRQLYESGQFRPTKGLVMWPRAAMIGWAARHPELEAASA